MAAQACDGCLGVQACWICHGDGCPRCAGSGQCHVCAPHRVVRLDPLRPQAAPADQAPKVER